MLVNGSLSKTAVSAGAGAKSELSSFVVAVLAVVTLLFLTGLFEELPEAVLAAVVIAAVIELVDIPALVQLYRAHTQSLGRIYGSLLDPTSSRRWPRSSACSCSTRSRGCSSASACRSCCSSTAPRGRTSPSLVKQGADGPFEDLERNPDVTAVPGVVIQCHE
jgi:hypothetical protein